MPTRPKSYGHILMSLAQLREKMGYPEDAEELRDRAAFEPASEPLPYPRFGMTDEPSEHQPTNLAPDIKRLVYEAEELILKGEYERGSRSVDEAFALAETYPRVEQLRQSTYFTNAATAFSRKGRIGEASEILKRDLALAEQFWGPDHPGLFSSLTFTASLYIDLQMFPRAQDLLDRSNQLVLATSGESSTQMEFIEQLRLRLATIQNDSAAVSEHTAKLQQLWIAIHGAKTKPLVIR